MFADVIALLRKDPVDHLTRSQLHDRFTEVRKLEGAVAAYKARLVNATDGLDDRGVDGAGMLRNVGRMSSKSASALAATANKLEQLPRTAEALADGRLTLEHAGAIAAAAEKTSSELADAELVPEDAAPPADLFAKRSREWASTHATPEDGADELSQQRRRRSYSHWVKDGMWKFLFELDEVAGKQVKSRIDAVLKELWRDDGGRDAPPDARTPAQRGADAFVALITAERGTHSGGGHGTPRVGAHLLVTADLRRLSDSPSGLAATVVDGAALPQAVLELLACNSTITPMIFDGPGRPIWVGRDHRHATIAQWRALIARDRGCVGCGAAPDRCEAHHVVPWEDFGATDITNLVLVCSRCHHDLHDRGSILRRSGDRWKFVTRADPNWAREREAARAADHFERAA